MQLGPTQDKIGITTDIMHKKLNLPLQKLKTKLRSLLLYSLLIFVGSTTLLVALLGIVPIPTSAFMMHRHIEDFQANKDFIPIDQQWRSKEKISPYIFGAVIAAEDQLFFDHFGFDVNSMFSAVKTYSSGGKLRGASTITQQVAKNLFLSPSRSLWRKGFEAWFTLLIEILWSKERILLVYVNIAEFGDHLFGIEAASNHFFDVPAQQLSYYQAALLAATLPNPLIFKTDEPSENLRDKQFWILGQMRNLGYL